MSQAYSLSLSPLAGMATGEAETGGKSRASAAMGCEAMSGCATRPACSNWHEIIAPLAWTAAVTSCQRLVCSRVQMPGTCPPYCLTVG